MIAPIESICYYNVGVVGGDLATLGLTDILNMDVVNLDHPRLFSKLFKAVLKYRLEEADFSRVSVKDSNGILLNFNCKRFLKTKLLIEVYLIFK